MSDREQIALQFAVALITNLDTCGTPSEVADAAFRFADAFIAMRDEDR